MRVIGIDLGTTTSEVAFVKQGNSTIIPNIEEGNSTVIPSVVLIEDDSIKVGVKAKNQMILKPKNTICEVKRLIGNIAEVDVNSKKYTPTEISSFILKKIKEVAEFYIGEKVTEAVITVPANFNDKQRRETKKAGELAGLKVERIINEPTAAAIAYGINNLNSDELILVYDFGGGTFDVSILELCDGILDVKCSRGNNHLGGKDIDEIIIKMIIEKFYKKTNIKLNKNDKRILSLLKRVAEQGKIDLSTEESTEIIAPYITVSNNEPIDLDIIISKSEFEAEISSIVSKTEKLIDEAIRDAGINYEDVNHVIMVGGSTRIPLVRKMIEGKFKNKIVSGVNPEEAIALGAAIQGEIKNGLEKRLIITDASSYTLGVEVVNKEFDPIIKRDSKLPAEVTKGYVTVEDNQEVATIRVYEGEDNDISNNTFITAFDLNGLPPASKGSERVDITFRYDLNGILDIVATIASTGKNIKKKINIESFKGVIEEVREPEEIRETEEVKEKVEEKIEAEELQAKVQQVYEEESNKQSEEDNQNDNKEVEYENIEQESIKEVEYENIEEKPIKEDEGEINMNEGKVDNEIIDEKQIYSDTVALTNYINAKKSSYEKELQDKVRDKLSDLLVAIRQSDFKLARSIQLDILEILPEDNEE